MAVFPGGHIPLLLAALKPLVLPQPAAGTQDHLRPLPPHHLGSGHRPLSFLWVLAHAVPAAWNTVPVPYQHLQLLPGAPYLRRASLTTLVPSW